MQPRSSITTRCTFALALLAVANLVWWHDPFLGVPIFFLLLILCGARLGTTFFPSFDRTTRSGLGILLALAWIMVLGSIFYYIAVLNVVTVSIIVLSILIAAHWWRGGAAGMTPQLDRGTAPQSGLSEGKYGLEGKVRSSEEVAPPLDPSHSSEDGHEQGASLGLRALARGSLRGALLCIPFGIFLALAFRMLARVDVYDSIRSPWEVLPQQFFVLVFLAATTLVLLALIRSRLAIIAAIPFFFLFFSITAITYPLGYGFDPFIHQTTESYIAEHGTITPKPFTYIGQYALVVTTHRATALPIPTIDRWLLPILLTIFLPIAGWAAFREPLAAILLPILPMSTFAVTTPQALGNALVLITILLTLGFGRNQEYQEIPEAIPSGCYGASKRSRIALWLLGLAATLTHPIAGIPLLVFLFLWSLQKPKEKPAKPSPAPNFQLLRRIPSWFDPVRPALGGLAILLGAIILPILFVLYGLASGAGSGMRSDALTRLPLVLGNLGSSIVALQSRFNMLLDFVYFYRLNLGLILIVGSLATLALLWKKSRWTILLPIAALITFVNGVLLDAAIDFSFLPLYEQSGYAERLFGIAELFLLPLFLIGFAWSIHAVIKKHGLVLRVGTIALCAGLLTASLYLTYPHPDAYTVERGFNVGAADFEAVQFIEEEAAGEPYIVLANQAVSATALKEFGFKQYFDFQTEDGPVTSFYYPIPTGGPLYDYYLKMVYDAPRAAVIREAMDRAGVRLGYLVVNRYWFQSGKIIEQAKGQTDDWWQFGNGAVHIFKFQQ